MRSFTTPTADEARLSFLWALPLGALLSLAAPAYSALFGTATLGLGAAPSMLFSGLIATGAIAAALAMASGLALAIAGALSHDIYYKTLDMSAPAERRILVARVSIV